MLVCVKWAYYKDTSSRVAPQENYNTLVPADIKLSGTRVFFISKNHLSMQRERRQEIMSEKEIPYKIHIEEKIKPTLAEVKELADTKKYKVVPVSCEILSDFITPIDMVKILKKVSSNCFILESAANNEMWGRYTFLGFDPKLSLTCTKGEMKIGDLKITTDNPSDYIRQILEEYKSPRLPYLPSFTGGFVGYFSYDYLNYSEPSVIREVDDTEQFKDVDLMLFDKEQYCHRGLEDQKMQG